MRAKSKLNTISKMPYTISLQYKPYSGSFSKPLYYRSITAHVTAQIEQFIAEANRHAGIESRYRVERAYGLYLGWRSLVAPTANDDEFERDDLMLEALLVAAQKTTS
jgi:hypothetical protein